MEKDRSLRFVNSKEIEEPQIFGIHRSYFVTLIPAKRSGPLWHFAGPRNIAASLRSCTPHFRGPIYFSSPVCRLQSIDATPFTPPANHAGTRFCPWRLSGPLECHYRGVNGGKPLTRSPEPKERYRRTKQFKHTQPPPPFLLAPP